MVELWGSDWSRGFCLHHWIGPLMTYTLMDTWEMLEAWRECILEHCLWGQCLVPGPSFSSSLISDFWPWGGKQLWDSPWCALSWCRSNITTLHGPESPKSLSKINPSPLSWSLPSAPVFCHKKLNNLLPHSSHGISPSTPKGSPHPPPGQCSQETHSPK